MSTLEDWIADTCETLGLPEDSLTRELRDQLLDLTRDVAHGVARIAGPLTTYLLGLAVAGGMPVATAVERVTAIAAERADQGEDGGGNEGRDGSNGDRNRRGDHARHGDRHERDDRQAQGAAEPA